MKHNLQSIKRRFAKYAWFFILLPIFTGVVSYLFATQQNGVYVASEQIALGQYEGENPIYTDQKKSKEIIQSTAFLQQVEHNQGLAMPVSQIQGSLFISNLPPNTLKLSLSGKNADTVKSVIKTIAKAYVSKSKDKYQKKTSIIKDKIQNLKDGNVAPENAYAKEKFVYDLQLKLLSVQEPMLLTSGVTVSEHTESPIERAVLGVLIGIILSLFFLLVPEILRDRVKY